jgi:hypothetical protein
MDYGIFAVVLALAALPFWLSLVDFSDFACIICFAKMSLENISV